jgi:hypothetical protein
MPRPDGGWEDRALRLVDAVAQQDIQGWLDVEITCVGCGTQNMEL